MDHQLCPIHGSALYLFTKIPKIEQIVFMCIYCFLIQKLEGKIWPSEMLTFFVVLIEAEHFSCPNCTRVSFFPVLLCLYLNLWHQNHILMYVGPILQIFTTEIRMGVLRSHVGGGAQDRGRGRGRVVLEVSCQGRGALYTEFQFFVSNGHMRPPHPCGQTDWLVCETIICPQLHWRVVTKPVDK